MSSLANLTRPSCAAASSVRIGSTARHGPHHGAQKSTTTGFADCRTSCSKVASVSSSTTSMLSTGDRAEPGRPPSGIASDASEPAEEGADTEKRHLPDRLEHDRAAHLRAAVLAVDEGDRHLDDAEPGAQRAVGGLDLEGVAARVDRAQVERLQHLAAEALEAAGQVAHADAEQHARVPRAARRDEAANRAPAADQAALDVA